MNKPKSKAKSLFILYLVGFILCGILCKAYIELCRMGESPTEVGGGYHLIILALLLFLFCPLLYFTQLSAWKEEKKLILILSRFLLFHHLAFIVGSIISIMI